MKVRFLISLLLILVITQSCKQEKQQITQATKDAAIRYAQGSQKVLGKGLMQAIKKHGLSYAITFCNDTAEVLTQSVSTVLNVKMKRVSDKNRNLFNGANPKELAYISKSKSLLLNGKTINSEFSISGAIVTAYIPIMTKPICLSCHGEVANMDSNVVAKIKKLYPDDNAMNYKDQELRGIWVIELQNIASE
jgi:hypothetical protein